jgi:hypothetical protein
LDAKYRRHPRHRATSIARFARALALSSAACVSALVFACNEEEPKGGLVVVVDTDFGLDKDIDHLRFEAIQNNRPLVSEDSDFGPNGLKLPASFHIPTTSDKSPVQLRAVAFKGGIARVQRDAVTPIPTSYVGYLRLPLNYLCDGMATGDGDSTCDAGLTCVQGACEPVEVPDSAIARSPTPGPGGTIPISGAACFDVASCFTAAASVQPDESDCSIPLPEGADESQINLGIQLELGAEGVCNAGGCWVVVERGLEGWSLEGSRLSLPKALCQRTDGTPAYTLALTQGCATKTPALPLCRSTGITISPSKPGVIPPLEPMGEACNGPSARACGACGTQARSCRNGAWSDWSPCTGEAECTPNESEDCGESGTRTCGGDCHWGDCQSQQCEGPSAQACGNCGTQTRECDNGIWSDWSACEAEGECARDDVEACDDGGSRVCGGDCSWTVCVSSGECAGVSTQTCGNCGTQTRDCVEGEWSDWSECVDDGVCVPNDITACGNDGTEVCGGNCQWSECGGQRCEGPSSEACGNCGTRTRSCDNGVWSDWSECSGEGECEPDAARGCGSGGTQVCGGSCTWNDCVGQSCTGPASESCGRCGTHSRACDNGIWSSWSDCTGQGTCEPNDTQACGSSGTQTCSIECEWGSCGNQVCVGESSQACGNCGSQTRTCNNATGAWSSWSSCSGQGECQPSATQACGTGGSQTCSSTCVWGNCTGQTCTGVTSQSCGNCGSQTRTCNNGVWSAWSACMNQGECSPNDSQACGTNGKQTCNNSCKWNSCTGQSCTGEAVEACGNCGTHSRTCNNGVWSTWSTCTGQGACAPGSVQTCATTGAQLTCDTKCQWSGTCPNATCEGPTTQACGNCGRQSRRCANGTWTAWSDCAGEGVCKPQDRRACRTGGEQLCDTKCQWSDCPLL